MLDVKQTLKDAEERMESAILYLDEELAHIRAGRANVAILDAVRVDSYGSKVPLNQVATVSTPDARTIAIRPWDRKAIRDIEKAIMDSDVGVTPENNGEVIRLNLPQPTGERRARPPEVARQVYQAGRRTPLCQGEGDHDGLRKPKKREKGASASRRSLPRLDRGEGPWGGGGASCYSARVRVAQRPAWILRSHSYMIQRKCSA